MCERGWATCIECGWTGIVDMDVCGCPNCGYMVSLNTSSDSNTTVNREKSMHKLIKPVVNKSGMWKQ
jgi:hypothetical protein